MTNLPQKIRYIEFPDNLTDEELELLKARVVAKALSDQGVSASFMMMAVNLESWLEQQNTTNLRNCPCGKDHVAAAQEATNTDSSSDNDDEDTIEV